jgi:hypothetical protein
VLDKKEKNPGRYRDLVMSSHVINGHVVGDYSRLPRNPGFARSV